MLAPHRVKYWLTSRPEDEEAFAAAVRKVCEVYQSAQALHESGVHLLSTDEKTGIQALERAAPTQRARPGQVERLEHEYERHGTQCLIANFEVATGRVVAPTGGDTRTEADFLAHIAATVAADPQGEWIFITDQLNTHKSESLVRWIAQQCESAGPGEPLGIKGQSGLLKSCTTRAEFLACPDHRIRFVYLPKHTSWLNQVECWFSILVRRLLKRSSFTSTEQLKHAILEFIDYFNQTMAKPFKWTYNGRPMKDVAA